MRCTSLSGPAKAAAAFSRSAFPGAHTHPSPSTSAAQPYTGTAAHAHSGAARHAYTHHSPMTRTAQVETRQVHQFAQRIRQRCCPACTQLTVWFPHPPQPLNVSHTASPCHSRHTHSDTAWHAFTHATHTPLPHATYRPSPDSSGAPVCPADPPMLLPPLHPAYSLVPTHSHQLQCAALRMLVAKATSYRGN